MSSRSMAVGDKCMGVNFTFKRIKCHRTGYKSSIVDFLRIITNNTYSDLKTTIEDYKETEHRISKINIASNKAVQLPENFYLLTEQVPLQERACSYLESRNLDMEFLNRRSIGFCNAGDYFGRIIIPFMNPNLCYYIGRSFVGSSLKHKNPKKEDIGVGKSEVFYNEERLKSKEGVLVEGAIDALSCGEIGFASLGWDLSTTQVSKIITSNLEHILIIPDKGFFEKAKVTGRKFLDYMKVSIANLDNLGDEHQTDVNDIGIDNIKFKRLGWSGVY